MDGCDGRAAAARLPHGARSLTAARATLRAGVVACLLLAALVLSVDHQEYRAFSRAGLRALATGALPLLALGALHLAALDPPGWLRPSAVRGALQFGIAADGLLALAVLGPVRRGAPPVFAITLAVACILAIGAAMELRDHGRRDRA